MVVLVIVFLLSLVCLVWGDLAARLNPDRSTQRFEAQHRLNQAALHPVLVQVAIVGRYIAMTIAPLITAALLWASLNPTGRALLMDDQTLRTASDGSHES